MAIGGGWWGDGGLSSGERLRDGGAAVYASRPGRVPEGSSVGVDVLEEVR